MKTRKIVLGFVSLATVACGATPPSPELSNARVAYEKARVSPAQKESPASLDTAKKAMSEAERAGQDDMDSPNSKDLATVAQLKAQLAEATAGVLIAQKRKAAAEQEYMRLTGERLQSTEEALRNTKQNLDKTAEQLAAEKVAREAAEKKAAQALADLQKIAAVKQESRGMVITLSGGVLFASNEATLLPAAIIKLNEVADALIKGNPDSNITVEGHTDSQGQRQYNMDLSKKRADAVRDQLVARGVAADRIKSTGLGPDRPVADNKSAEGRANNRRVEIIVEPAKPH